MRKHAIIAGVVLLLSACGDPLAGIDRISDIELADDEMATRVAPTEEEIAREGFFGTAAATGAVAAPIQTVPEPKKRGGVLGLFRRNASSNNDTSASDTDAQTTPFGTVLPYGVVARVCDAKGKSLGQKVDQPVAKGYALYDSAPGSAVARTYYITGFSDGCPRQITAANVLLGAPSSYEALHYGPAGQHLTVAATDEAYEKVKARVCGARPGKPCGSKIRRLEKTTFFISAYDSFGNSARWSELLVHDGEVVASAIKSNG
ncbi:MAG: hypothetical protein ACSHWS_08065 [Sulfitobacter sp.]